MKFFKTCTFVTCISEYIRNLTYVLVLGSPKENRESSPGPSNSGEKESNDECLLQARKKST